MFAISLHLFFLRTQDMNRILKVASLSLLAVLLIGSFRTQSVGAQASGQKTFSSSKEALDAFIAAVRSGNTPDMVAILGPGSEPIVNSGDAIADQKSRASFVASYDAAHSLVANKDGGFTLQIGKNNFPTPVPLVHSGDKWYWNGAEGKEEILYRRVGHNEIDAINACKGVIAAQHDYAASGHDGQPAGAYAKRIVSTPGKQNGIYWEAKEGEPDSPAGPMLAAAAEEGYDTSGNRVPYHGYYYRMLPVANGFALAAYPAEYRSSGVMTFVATDKGVIYEKDLGPDTTKTALAMSNFTPDKTWRSVK
jgi:Protein of unknown function (DUF2950)